MTIDSVLVCAGSIELVLCMGGALGCTFWWIFEKVRR